MNFPEQLERCNMVANLTMMYGARKPNALTALNMARKMLYVEVPPFGAPIAHVARRGASKVATVYNMASKFYIEDDGEFSDVITPFVISLKVGITFAHDHVEVDRFKWPTRVVAKRNLRRNELVTTFPVHCIKVRDEEIFRDARRDVESWCHIDLGVVVILADKKRYGNESCGHLIAGGAKESANCILCPILSGVALGILTLRDVNVDEELKTF